MAPSAAAAEAINMHNSDVGASTIHRAMGLRPKRGGVVKPRKGTPDWYRLCLSSIWVIDEYSMVSEELLVALDQLGREASFTSSLLPFGGRSVLCFGDPCQLSPVNGSPVYNWGLWRSRFRFVELVEQVRAEDQQLRDILSSMREGELSDTLYDALNQRVVGADTENLRDDIRNEAGGSSVLTLAGLREDVRSLNALIMSSMFHGVVGETIEAEDSITKSLRGLSASTSTDADGVVHTARHLPKGGSFESACDSKFSTERKVVLYKGAPVIVIKNMDKNEKLYNGARAVVEHITSKQLTLWPGGA